MVSMTGNRNFLAILSMLSFGFLLLLSSGLICNATEPTRRNVVDIQRLTTPNENGSIITTRKLLQSTEDGDANPIHGDANRIGGCSKNDIMIHQGPTNPLPSGIPLYLVEIVNVCNSGCSICEIHVSCGWFSSARLINPGMFRRLSYDDCLVNNGDPLTAGQALSFQYANTYSYPLSVSSVKC